MLPITSAQFLVQLQGKELELCEDFLRQGVVGLEIADFARPNLLASGWQERLAEICNACRNWPGPITMHGPFIDLNPFSLEPGLRHLTLQRYRQALHIAKQLDACYLVLHSQFKPNLGQPDYTQHWLEGNLQFWSGMLPEIEASGTVVLLENLWDPRPDHLVELLQHLASPYIKVCLDVAHAHLFSEVTVDKWVSALADNLTYVHLSDNRGQWDEHLPLGVGNVDFDSLWSELAQTSQCPWYVLEVPTFTGAVRSLQWLGWDIKRC